jgi:hypothetical protein
LHICGNLGAVRALEMKFGRVDASLRPKPLILFQNDAWRDKQGQRIHDKAAQVHSTRQD